MKTPPNGTIPISLTLSRLDNPRNYPQSATFPKAKKKLFI
jgi:hypothetical protein